MARITHWRRRVRGFALLELTVAIILVSLLGAGAMYAYQQNLRRTETRENAQLIIETAAELQKNFGATNQYGTVTTAIAVQSRSVPPQLRDAGANTATNSYGGAITAAVVQLSVPNDSVALQWGNVPQAQCAALVQAAHQVARRVRVNAVVVKAIDAPAPDPALLVANCEGAQRVPVIFDIPRTPQT